MKIFASDIDGTLFFGDHTPSISNQDIDAIRRFQEQGHLFGVCTGRPLQGVLAMDYDIHYDFLITCNGAAIFDGEANPLWIKAMDFSTMKEVYEAYHEESTFTNMKINHALYTLEKEFPWPALVVHRINALDELKQETILGLSFLFQTEEKAHAVSQAINQRFSDVEATQNKAYVDIVPKGCTKGTGLLFVKETVHADEAYGIGDSYNDHELLEASDVAFAMAQGEKHLQTPSDYVVSSVNEAIEICLR